MNVVCDSFFSINWLKNFLKIRNVNSLLNQRGAYLINFRLYLSRKSNTIIKIVHIGKR